MSHTHQVEIRGEVVTKTYVDWSRGEHLREWAALQVISAAEPDLVPTPIRLYRPGTGPGLRAGARAESWPAGSTPPGAGLAGARPASTPTGTGLEGAGPVGAGLVGPTAAGRAPAGVGPAVVMSRLAGVPLGGCLSAEQLAGLRIALDALWSVPSEDLEPIDFGGFVARVRRAISSWEGEGVIADAHAAAVEWLAGSAADELVKPQDVVVGHGDPNLANYLWDGRRVRIIDFEDAGQGDLAVELANLVEHLASRGTNWSGFLDRYSVDADRLQSARRLYAAFWLTLIRPGGPSADRNPPGTAELQAERLLRLLG